VRARDLRAHGAMAVLLKDAIKPNLVQTLEHTPGLHPRRAVCQYRARLQFVIATKNALKLADYVVTEAGFGADLGAEKFIDIKCRKAGLRPGCGGAGGHAARLKYHGGADLKELNQENLEALERGFVNIERHVHNIREALRSALRGGYQPFYLRHSGGNQITSGQIGPARACRWSCPPLGRRRQRR
jgi:formate--tetrahydrofolate ligase